MQVAIEQTKTDGSPDLERVVLETAAVGRPSTDELSVVPHRILIAPAGEVRSAAGSFLVDDEAMAATVAAFKAHGTDLPIDYEHQTLGGPYSSPTGQAPAAGWIKAIVAVSSSSPLEDKNGQPLSAGLWAEVSWTAEAREKLAARQYRYISPVALVRRSDRRLVGIHSVALTNKPAIVGMRPVVNRNEALHTTDPLGQPNDTVLTALRQALALDESAEADDVLTACVDQIRTLRQAEADRQAEDRVAAAMTAGKLTAAQRDWALSLARRDPAEFDLWQAVAPQVVVLGRTEPPRGPSGLQSLSRRAVESAAQAEWRTNKAFLEQLCSEEAYVANALRGCEI